MTEDPEEAAGFANAQTQVQNIKKNKHRTRSQTKGQNKCETHPNEMADLSDGEPGIHRNVQ